METRTALTIVRLSAAYDLAVTAAFALPWTAVATLDTLARLHRDAGLDGAVPTTDDPLTILFANMAGSIVVLWALLRLWRPSLVFGAVDTAGRALFSLAMIVALSHGASEVIYAVLVPEVAWLVVQGAAVAAAAHRARTAPRLAA